MNHCLEERTVIDSGHNPRPGRQASVRKGQERAVVGQQCCRKEHLQEKGEALFLLPAWDNSVFKYSLTLTHFQLPE